MPRQSSRHCDSKTTDILVVGGGPAGSTAAALLARRGWDVTLIERDRHPRFHIGESLLPLNLPIFERLGVFEQVQSIGVRKLGADFPADNAQGYGVFPPAPWTRATAMPSRCGATNSTNFCSGMPAQAALGRWKVRA